MCLAATRDVVTFDIRAFWLPFLFVKQTFPQGSVTSEQHSGTSELPFCAQLLCSRTCRESGNIPDPNCLVTCVIFLKIKPRIKILGTTGATWIKTEKTLCDSKKELRQKKIFPLKSCKTKAIPSILMWTAESIYLKKNILQPILQVLQPQIPVLDTRDWTLLPITEQRQAQIKTLSLV